MEYINEIDFEVIDKEEIDFGLDNGVVKLYPELENLTINPSKEQQQFKSEKYGYDNVTINAVNNEIDENIKAENIKSGTSILGVDGNVVELVGEEITITPKSEEQEFTPTAPSNGFTKVKVEAQTGIDPNNYFTTTMTSSNSKYFCRDYLVKKTPVIKIDSSVTSLNYAFADLYDAEELFIDGDTSNVQDFSYCFNNSRKLKTLPSNLKIDSATNLTYFCYQCYGLENIPIKALPPTINNLNYAFYGVGLKQIVDWDYSNVKYMGSTYCNSKLESVPDLNTPLVQSFGNCFYNCSNLVSVGVIDCSSATNIYDIVSYSQKIRYLGGFKDFGKAFPTTLIANNTTSSVVLSSLRDLTHDSLMNVIYSLWDLASAGINTQRLILGTNLKKLLSDDELQLIADKGWTVS